MTDQQHQQDVAASVSNTLRGGRIPDLDYLPTIVETLAGMINNTHPSARVGDQGRFLLERALFQAEEYGVEGGTGLFEYALGVFTLLGFDPTDAVDLAEMLDNTAEFGPTRFRQFAYALAEYVGPDFDNRDELMSFVDACARTDRMIR